jgi:hypothetical protein
MESYYSNTKNTCKLKLHIPIEIVNDTFKLLQEPYENAGVFYFDKEDKLVHNDKHKGGSDSVYTPNNVINYHTHPIHCYIDAKTSFGSPSGEDYRETIKFALAGNKAHMVFTVEGVYVIQNNPCKIRRMKSLLNDRQRGILIFLIEEYFKSTHNFRCTHELNKLHKSGINLNAYSFADFASTFDIGNLLCEKEMEYRQPNVMSISEIGHTGIHSKENNNIMRYSGKVNETFCKIPNNGFPEVTGNYFKTNCLENYIDNTDEVYYITKDGKEYKPTKKETLASISKELKTIIKLFETNRCETLWNNKPNTWFFVNFFPCEHYIKNLHFNGSYITPKKENCEKLYLTHEPFIRIFSDKKSGCTVHAMAKNSRFKFSKMSFGNGLTDKQRVKLYRLLKQSLKSGKFETLNTLSTKLKADKIKIKYEIDYIML